jgi:hypothetical protein
MTKRVSVCLLAFVLLISGARNAAAVNIQLFDLDWSGAAEFANTAVATGQIGLDLDLIPNPGTVGFSTLPPYVTSLTVTISGASSGNGTFGLADFSNWYFDTGGATLDFSQELVGQSTPGGPWAGVTDPGAGDFNLFGATPGAPNGSWYFTLTTNNGQGDSMGLTSFRPADLEVEPVPEPGTWALLGTGIVAFAVKRYRRRA